MKTLIFALMMAVGTAACAKEEPKKPVKESYDSEEAAKKRLRQIEFFKRQG